MINIVLSQKARGRIYIASGTSKKLAGFFRGNLHVSESAYESPHDSVHNLYANKIGSPFFFCSLLQWFVNTFQSKTRTI
jgi:hypothetical protein